MAAVWAEENTREAIFSALRRKETFATSGNRISVRFFGGYRMNELDLNSENVISEAYRNGVPMGSDLVSKAVMFLTFSFGPKSKKWSAASKSSNHKRYDQSI